MALMQFINISQYEKDILLDIARQSIAQNINRCYLPTDAFIAKKEEYSPLLQAQAASFVTLTIDKQLRGCIGSLEAHQALINDVAEHAYDAAFKDPRFSAVIKNELSQLEIHISILTPSEPLLFSSEADLISQIKQGVDGLILEDDFHRGTFLPSVWEQISEPGEFLNHLKLKAGLNIDDWHAGIRVSRYRAISFD